MDIVSTILSAVLFAAFVPGVLLTFPAGQSKMTVLAVHAVLFAVVTSFIMKWYWSMKEHMGNHGITCPNGYTMAPDQTCVPVGHATYEGKTA
jgi:hypothetical protein